MITPNIPTFYFSIFISILAVNIFFIYKYKNHFVQHLIVFLLLLLFSFLLTLLGTILSSTLYIFTHYDILYVQEHLFNISLDYGFIMSSLFRSMIVASTLFWIDVRPIYNFYVVFISFVLAYNIHRVLEGVNMDLLLYEFNFSLLIVYLFVLILTYTKNILLKYFLISSNEIKLKSHGKSILLLTSFFILVTIIFIVQFPASVRLILDEYGDVYFKVRGIEPSHSINISSNTIIINKPTDGIVLNYRKLVNKEIKSLIFGYNIDSLKNIFNIYAEKDIIFKYPLDEGDIKLIRDGINHFLITDYNSNKNNFNIDVIIETKKDLGLSKNKQFSDYEVYKKHGLIEPDQKPILLIGTNEGKIKLRMRFRDIGIHPLWLKGGTKKYYEIILPQHADHEKLNINNNYANTNFFTNSFIGLQILSNDLGEIEIDNLKQIEIVDPTFQIDSLNKIVNLNKFVITDLEISNAVGKLIHPYRDYQITKKDIIINKGGAFIFDEFSNQKIVLTGITKGLIVNDNFQHYTLWSILSENVKQGIIVGFLGIIAALIAFLSKGTIFRKDDK